MLINDILDLSKIESGTVVVDVGELPLRGPASDYVERTFRHVAEAKSLEFVIELGPQLPRSMSPTPSACSRSSRTCCRTRSSSPTRARSRCRVERGRRGWSADNEELNRAQR